MVLFNYSAKELTAKIVYYGPGLGGKTTCLEYIYKSLPAKVKGKMLSLSTQTDRTLFFDFLPVELGKIFSWRVKIQLYTVPGQVFYDATRKIVLKGADGVVFVVDSQADMLNSNIESWQNLNDNLKENNIDIKSIPLIIQYNKRDLKNAMPVAEMEKHINKLKVASFETVATDGRGVLDALKSITKIVLQNLQKQYKKVFQEERKEEAPEEKEEVVKPAFEKTKKDELSNVEEKMHRKLPVESQPEDKSLSYELPSDDEIADLPVKDEELLLDDSHWKNVEIGKPSSVQVDDSNPMMNEEEIFEQNNNSMNEIEELEEVEEIEEIEEISEVQYSPETVSFKSPIEDTQKTKTKLGDTWKSSKANKTQKQDDVIQIEEKTLMEEEKEEEVVVDKSREETALLQETNDNIIKLSSDTIMQQIILPVDIKIEKEKGVLNVAIKLLLKIKLD